MTTKTMLMMMRTSTISTTPPNTNMFSSTTAMRRRTTTTSSLSSFSLSSLSSHRGRSCITSSTSRTYLASSSASSLSRRRKEVPLNAVGPPRHYRCEQPTHNRTRPRFLSSSSSSSSSDSTTAAATTIITTALTTATTNTSSSFWRSWISMLWETLIRSPMKWYSRTIDTYPLITKCITAGFVAGAGDISSQYLFMNNNSQEDNIDNEKKAPGSGSSSSSSHLDPYRTARFVFMNVFFVGPTLHYFYKWLSMCYPGTTMRSVVKRVIWDEFIFTPIYYPIFLTCLWKLEYGSTLTFDTIGQMLYNEMPKLIVTEWCIYVPAQAINFRLVPVKYQVLFVNIIGIVWNGFLSATAQHATHTTTTTHDENKPNVKLDDDEHQHNNHHENDKTKSKQQHSKQEVVL